MEKSDSSIFLWEILTLRSCWVTTFLILIYFFLTLISRIVTTFRTSWYHRISVLLVFNRSQNVFDFSIWTKQTFTCSKSTIRKKFEICSQLIVIYLCIHGKSNPWDYVPMRRDVRLFKVWRASFLHNKSIVFTLARHKLSAHPPSLWPSKWLPLRITSHYMSINSFLF